MGFIKNQHQVAKVNSDLSVASQAVSEHDSVRLPGNVDSRGLTNGQLYSALSIAGIEGISPYAPRSQNLEALARHVDGLKKAAGDKAVNDWLESKESAVQVYSSQIDQTQFAPTELDGLPLPRNQRVADLTPPQLTTLLTDAGIPGVSHDNGRRQNLEAYAAFLDGVRKPAEKAAVSKFAHGK
jgi:hypothetical protein